MSNSNATPDIPMGFGAALMQNPAALEWFSALSTPAQQAIVERTHSIRSKEEMRAFVGQIAQENQNSAY